MIVVSKETGRILSQTTEHTIRGKKYVVTSEYKEKGQTVEDILQRLIDRHVCDVIQYPDKGEYPCLLV